MSANLQYSKLTPANERGARRRKFGETGRLHLDRRLPFIVINRLKAGEAAAGSLARRVALNSPAYLTWDEGIDDKAALSLLNELGAEIGTSKLPLLVIEVHDLEQSPAKEGSQHLTPFVTLVAGGQSEREHRAREALIKAMRHIEIDLRHPDVAKQPISKDHWLVQSLAQEASTSNPLLVGLPQIHRRDDGGIYPQLAHDLAVACGDALLRAACAYLDDEDGNAPAHYRSLGRSAFLRAALKADEELDEIAASFDFLLSVSPINTTEALEQFIADGEEKTPNFRYRPLSIDPDEIKRRLYRLDFARLEDPLLQRLFTDKRHEIDAQLTMLATRNTPAFRPASLFLYGAVSTELLKDAQALLAAGTPRSARGESIGAADVASAARELIGYYSHKDAFFDASVEVRDDVSGLLVTRNRLMVGSSTLLPRDRLDALLAHEVSTHLLTFLNGSAQGLSIFRTGLANYEGIQEGLGVFAEWAVGGLTWTRMRLLAARVVAVDAMQHGADFIETYRLLRHDIGFSIAGAFGIATRVHRSGGLAKDSIYLEGFRSVVDYIVSGGSLAPFWMGKIARQDVPAIEELLQRGLVKTPLFVPNYLDRPDVKERLSYLKAGIGLDQLLSMEPA